MTLLLAEVVPGHSTKVQDYADNVFDLIGDCLQWIAHLFYTVFDSIAHGIQKILNSEAFTTIWTFLKGSVIYVVEGIESILKSMVHACTENETCSRVARETKNFIVHWFHEFETHVGFGSLIICTAAAFVIYVVADKVIVGIIRCFGFGRGGITSQSHASSMMRSHQGYVPIDSECATYQRIGATGVVPEYKRSIKRLLALTFAAASFFFILRWLILHDFDEN